MSKLYSALGLVLLVAGFPAAAQQPPMKPPELEVLKRDAGDWDMEVTNKVSVWNPAEKKIKGLSHSEFVLDGWFLLDVEVSHDVAAPEELMKSLFLSTFDPKAKKYMVWFFQSSGNTDHLVGTWDESTKTFAYRYANPPPNTTGRVRTQIVDENTIDGELAYSANDGQTMFAMDWTRSRRGDPDSDALRKDWAQIGKPIVPLPSEIKKLEAFIGEWDSEFINRPAKSSPQGRTSHGTMKAEWILDGRFLLGTSEVGNHQSIWVVGFDPKRDAYRYVRFTNAGEVEEFMGVWNDNTRSFEWKAVLELPKGRKTSTNRFIGNDAIQAHILSEDNDGNILLDLTIRSTRRN